MSDLHDTPYAWARLALTLAIACVGNVGMWAVIIVMPSLQAEFGVARGDASLPYTVTMIGFAVGSLVIGRWVDRWGVTRALWAATLAQAAGFALAATSPGFWTVTALHLALGFGAAGSFGPLIADISHWFMRRRGIAVAIAACGNYLAGALLPLVLSPMTASHGWRGSYLLLAALLPVIVIPLSLFLRRRIDAAATARADSAAAERAGATGLGPGTLQWMLVAAGIACCVAMSMPQVHIVALCVDLGFGALVGSQMLSLMLAGGVVSRIVSGLLADRIGGLRTLILGSFLQLCALILYLPAGGIVSLYVVSALFGLAQGGIVPSYAVVVREYMPAREAGRRVGLVMTATIVGMALGGWMSGWLYDVTGGYLAAFLNGIGWNLLNLSLIGVILWLATRRFRTA